MTRLLTEWILLVLGDSKHRQLLHERLLAEVKRQKEAGEEAVVCHQGQGPLHIRSK